MKKISYDLLIFITIMWTIAMTGLTWIDSVFAYTANGSVLINYNTYGENRIETFVVFPFFILIGAISLTIMIKRIVKENNE